MEPRDPALELPAHFFRHEFGRLVAGLTRRFGVQRVSLCEDAAQDALMRAISAWPKHGVPDDKGAWLYRVAHNCVVDVLRGHKRRASDGAEAALSAEHEPVAATAPAYFPQEVADDVLRLLFVCADPKIAAESRLVLALRTLCGFSIGEIALRLFQSEAAIYKRLQRAQAVLRESPPDLETPPAEELRSRLPEVLQMLYLLFNEGYSSAEPDTVIRYELCEEAVRLTLLVAEHPLGASASTDALLALMYLHAARFEARLDPAGELLLLGEQDRTLWDRELIDLGLSYLHRSARDETFSRFHIEAAIAAEHCLAKTFGETRWGEIVRLYEALERVAPSPLNALNHGIAVAEWQGPEAGLALLAALTPPAWLFRYYLWDAALGELYRRSGDPHRARQHLERARELAPTHAEKALLTRRLNALVADAP